MGTAPSGEVYRISRQDLLTSLWRLASLSTHLRLEDQSPLIHLGSILEVLCDTESSLSHISHSIIALIKHRILYEMAETLPPFNHHIFPIETAVAISDDELGTPMEDESMSSMMRARRQEARIYVLAEFLQHCNSNVLPYMAVDTLKAISHRAIPRGGIHHTHQVRLADGVDGIFTADRFPNLLPVIINFECWTLYAKQPGIFDERPWLYDPVARRKIKNAFTLYERKLRSTPTSSVMLVRLKKILQGLDSWHQESNLPPPETGTDPVEASTTSSLDCVRKPGYEDSRKSWKTDVT